jgi:hypothetical protein
MSFAKAFILVLPHKQLANAIIHKFATFSAALNDTLQLLSKKIFGTLQLGF